MPTSNEPEILFFLLNNKIEKKKINILRKKIERLLFWANISYAFHINLTFSSSLVNLLQSSRDGVEKFFGPLSGTLKYEVVSSLEWLDKKNSRRV